MGRRDYMDLSGTRFDPAEHDLDRDAERAAINNLPMPLMEWVLERLENCQSIAATKQGADRDSWLEDAQFFAAILLAIKDHPLHRLPPTTPEGTTP